MLKNTFQSYWCLILQWVNSQHIPVSEYDVIPGDRRQIARLLFVSAKHFYICPFPFRYCKKQRYIVYCTNIYMYDYGDRKGVKRWTQAGQYSCQGCWHSSRNDWAGLWQYSPDNINGLPYEISLAHMRWGWSLCLLFTFICWHDWPVTTAAKSRQTWPATSGEEEGRVDPAQKCKHLKCQNRKLIFALHINWCKVPHSVRHKSNRLIKSWTKNLRENEDGWVEKLKPTMMNWCVLCLL